MFDVAGRAATPDSPLIFCIALTFAVFVWCEFPSAADERRPWNSPLAWRTSALLGASMGLGMLAKGPVAWVLPTAIIGMFLLVVRRQDAAAPRVDGDASNGAERSNGSVTAAAVGKRQSSNATSSNAPQSPGMLRRAGQTAYSCVSALFHLFERRHFLATAWSMRPVTLLVCALLVAAPWYVAVGLRTEGEFLRGFFVQHNMQRALQSFEGHRGGPWFYPVVLLIGFFPWSILTLPVALDWKRRMAAGERPHGAILAMCWAGVWIAAFTCAGTKLPSYITPTYPALALLSAEFLRRWANGDAAVSERWVTASLATLAVVGVGLLVGLPLAAAKFLPGDGWLGAIGLIPLLGAAAVWRLRTTGR
ncbi:MAG TPA: phospholipid carrier-dependent glycosyltransferase, partial [Pirellulaceae bacterium]|nr:phospholipid carrier-dependent glycosyltransferase [Pirellulaceae bacterium]